MYPRYDGVLAMNAMDWTVLKGYVYVLYVVLTD